MYLSKTFIRVAINIQPTYNQIAHITNTIMNLPTIKPIKWKEAKGHQPEPQPEPCTQQPNEPYLPKPLHCATGRLKELEDRFILLTQRGKGQPKNRQELVKFFDRYKRTQPTANELNELHSLMCLN